MAAKHDKNVALNTAYYTSPAQYYTRARKKYNYKL